MSIAYSQSVADIIRERFSCRTYSGESLPEAARTRLAEAVESMRTGPLGSPLRFSLVAAGPGNTAALKGLGTYGTIRGAAAFVFGSAEAGGMYLEDFGHAFEQLILLATDLGLGSCWLGGFFNRGGFSRRMQPSRRESIPAVAAIGLIPDADNARRGLMRAAVGGSRRRPWEVLFFDADSGEPLTPEGAGAYGVPLEMLRLAPSASNRQPWRIVRQGHAWHFCLQRTPGYPGRMMKGLFGIEDLQRVDIGIAMCHFELTAREQGLGGAWIVHEPAPALPRARTAQETSGIPSREPIEYVVSWEG